MLASHATAIGEAALLAVDALILFCAVALLWRSDAGERSRQRYLFVALTAGAILGRWGFEFLPNIQPVTILVLLGGALLGARRGIAMALIITMVSNIQLGSGTWSVFQASGWAMVALVGALLKDRIVDSDGSIRLAPVIITGLIAAPLFDWWVSLSVLPTVADGGAFFGYLIAGIPYDLLHMMGNLTFALWLVPCINILLERHRSDSIDDSAGVADSNPIPVA